MSALTYSPISREDEPLAVVNFAAGLAELPCRSRTYLGVLFDFAMAAERAWETELDRLFGKDACNQRYQPAGKGEPGSKLRELHDLKRMAWDASRAAHAFSQKHRPRD